MPEQDFTRRNYLVNPGFQLRFMAYLGLALVASLTILYFSNSYYFDTMIAEGVDLGLDEDHPYYQFIDEQRQRLLQTYLVVSSVVFVGLMIFGLFLSHRIAGPLYHLSRVMRVATVQGGDGARAHLRDGDFFGDMEDVLNDMINHFEDEARKTQEEALSNLRDMNSVRAVAGARILIVEDNEINQELAVELLASNGVSAEVAENGEEALRILDIDPDFDGILMDGQMPVMDGYEATQRLRQDDRFKDIPIIAMTANLLAADLQRALDIGMNDSIAKPLDVSELFTTMARWVKPGSPTYKSDGSRADDSEIIIPHIDGVNVNEGLNRTQGNPKLYLRLLQRFVETQGEFAARFERARTDTDPKAAEREAHTLKGVAGNVGMEEIQALALSLEQLCKDDAADQEISAKTKELSDKMVVVIGNIQQALDAIETGTVVRIMSAEEYAEKIAEIRRHIQNSDTEAVELIEEILDNSSEGVRTQLKEVATEIQNYDFDKAETLLDKLVLELNS